MLYLDAEAYKHIEQMRRDDPHGRHSNGKLEEIAMLKMLERKIAELTDEPLRDILETILDLI